MGKIGLTMEVGSDGVALITISNPPVNALALSSTYLQIRLSLTMHLFTMFRFDRILEVFFDPEVFLYCFNFLRFCFIGMVWDQIFIYYFILFPCCLSVWSDVCLCNIYKIVCSIGICLHGMVIFKATGF